MGSEVRVREMHKAGARDAQRRWTGATRGNNFVAKSEVLGAQRDAQTTRASLHANGHDAGRVDAD